MSMDLADGKVFEKCELALELRDKHFIPFEEIGVYVCIAARQSNYNTAAVGHGGYYGMYQLGSEFWCDEYGAGKACSVKCSSLIDDDIGDDLSCVRVIYDEHLRIFNNGFNAWPSAQDCQSQGNNFVQECFIEENQIVKSDEPAYSVIARQEKVSGSVGEGKVYERCDLARELHYQHKIAIEHIATWVCIAKHESAFNTSAVGRLNWDGSEDHGLFQISDIYWCGDDGKACDVKCSELRDDDISNDVRCIKKIHAEHQRLSGDGFNAWAVYPRCKGNSKQYAQGCFDKGENEVLPYRPEPGVQQPKKAYSPLQRKNFQKSPEKGKVYGQCELAQELRFKHKIPMEQVATWVCIAKHESNFNTSAVGRLNADGSEDHGLFQISDLFWCSPPGHGTGCGVACSKFEDNDISDDVECMLKIHDEHTFLSGDGFNAWSVYRPHCQGRSIGYIDGCFNSDENEILPRPAVTQPSTPPRTSHEPITTTSKSIETTPLIELTMPPLTTITQERSFKSSVKSTAATTTVRRVDKSPTTVKPFNIFDLYFNSIGKGSPNNDIKPTQKNNFYKPSITTKAAASTRTYDRKLDSINEIKRDTTKTTRRTTSSGTPHSTSKAINQKSPSVTTTRVSSTTKSTRATSRSTPKTVIAVRPKSDNPTKLAKAATLKPFNLFDFYLNDYTSRAPISYQPLQFSDRSTVIVGKKSEKLTRSTTRSSSTTSPNVAILNPTSTTRRQQIKFDLQPTTQSPTVPSTVRSLSIYNAFGDYGLNSNRIGRGNITPHSIEYLLKLTTPRTAFRRA